VIEPDINERMARFSPSQVQDDVDPIASEIASRAAVPTSQPTMAMPDVDPIARQIAENDRESLDAAVLGARAVNPDEAARAIQVGRKVGIPAEVARADMQRAEQQAYLTDLRSKDFLRTDPVMANFLANKEFAEVAHDDVGVLDAIRPIMQDWAMVYWTGATPGMRRGFERGQLGAERGEIGGMAMAGLAQPKDFERASKIRDRMRELVDVGFLGATTEVIAQNLAQIRGIGTFTVGGAALGSVVPVVGTVAGGALGATAGVVATTGQMEAGNLYLDLREEGVEDDVAIPVSVAGGFLNGVIEVVGMKIAAKPFQALAKRFMAEAVAKAVAQPTTRAALAAAGKGYILQVGTGASEEALQEVVIIAGEEIAKAASGIDSETGLRQATERVVDAFVQGAMGSAILGGIGPGANLYVDLSRAANTERQQVFFEKLATAGKDSRLAKRSPEAYERFLEAQAKDGPAETIYVDGRTAQELFAQSGLTAAQLEEVLPGIKAQVDEAVATGGDVTIQTAQFGARLANTELGNALLPHMRLSPDAMSATEAQAFEAERQAVVEEARTILAAKQEADAAFVAEAQQVEDEAFEQVRAVGQFTDIEARTIAKLRQAMVVVDAAEAGMTPAQYQRERGVPLVVQGEKTNVQAAQSAVKNAELQARSKLFGWYAQRELAKIAESEGVDLSTLTRDQYAQYAIDNGLAIDDDHLRMAAVLRNAKTIEEYASMRKSMRAAANPMQQQADAEFAAFAQRIKRDATASTTISPGVRIRSGTANSDTWLYFKVNSGATTTGETHKAYAGFADPYKSLTQNRVEQFLQFLQSRGYNGDVKTIQDIDQGSAISDQIVMHGATKADADLALQLSQEFFGNELNFLETGMDTDSGSYSQNLAEKIKSDIAARNQSQQAQQPTTAFDQAAISRMDADYLAAVERGDMEAAQRMVDEAARAANQQRVTRFTVGNRGLLNNQVLNYDKLSDDEMAEVEVLLPLGLQQPRDVPANATFFFTDEGLIRQNRLIELLKKAAKGRVIETTAYVPNDPVWTSNDGQVAVVPEQIKSANPVTYDEQGNIVPLSRRFDITSPKLFEQAATLNADYFTAIERGDTETVQSMIDEAAERQMPSSQVRDAAGKLLRIYHGSQRIDRVGNRLLKKRATSGPMPFFTDTRAIAEGYAQGKEDTSIENIGYEQWFKYKPRGQRGTVTLDQAWFYLTPEERATATERLYTVGYENPDEGTGEIVGNTKTIASRDHVQFLIRQAKGNALTAAKELWLNSGSLFNDEQKFMDVLKGMGLGERFVYDSPHAVNSGIIEAYANITNPLDTSAIPTSVVDALQKRANRVRKPADEYGQDAWDKRTRDPQSWMETLRSDIAEGRTQAWTSIPDWATDVLTKLGYDGIKDSGGKYGGDPHVVWIPFNPQQIKFANPITKDGSGKIIPLSERFDLTSPMMFRQAAPGPARGGFDPRTLNVLVGKGGDVSTLAHELIHLRVAEYLRMARGTTPPARVNADLETLFDFMGVEGATFQERLDNYETMTIDQRRPLEEKVTYNFEVYLYEGKAPSVELRGVFDRLAAWMRRVYKSIRDDLNAIYRREFGTDLPILTPEVRSVFDRMLASEEQIKRQEAISGMKGLFQTQAESGMGDAEWAAYQAMQQEATDAAVTDLNTASMRQLQWLGNARARILRDLQKKHEAKRKEVTAEVAATVRLEPVYRAMTYLRTGKFVDADGAEVAVEGPHRLDTKRVKKLYETVPTAASLEAVRATGMPMPAVIAPDIAKLGTGKGGMMGVDGLDPDLVAETFGYSSGDEMIRALIAARPMKEIVAERTDAEMLRRFGDMTSPEAIEAEVQAALHNEARARFVAVELRYLSKATEPARVMVDAAKQVARDLIAAKRVRDVRPSDFVAAEARAARDASRIGSPVDAVAVGRAAYTRTYNERIAAGADELTAVAEATTASVEAARMAQERTEEIKARYGADPEQARIRAKRAQLYQNQLAAEALRVKAEVDKQVKYLRRVLRDENVKRMGAQAADQVAGLLDRFEVAAVSLKRLDERKALTDWLAEQEAAGLVPDIAPEIANEARRVNYREMKVSEFRDLVDAVKQIEFIGKNEQKLRLAEERAAFEEKRDEIVTRIRAAGKVRGLSLDPRTPLTGIGRAAAFLRGFAAQHLKAASIARVLDGGKEDGPLWNAIIRTANDASDMETTMRAKASLRLGEILKPVFALGGMGGKGMHFPSIGRSLNREARLAIALNMGNDGNRQRLLDGEGWTLEQIQPVLESLTEAEWQAVQQVWDFIDGYRPEIAAKERRLYGKEPTWVTPVPFTVRTVDGKDVSLQGGYYPIKYDPVASDRVATVDAAEEAKRDLQGAYTAATTRRSFVKARAKEVVDRPILYTLDAAFSGVNDVIHDLSWHEWLISTNRLLRDVKFANAVRETRGPEFLKQLRDWTKDNATGARGQQVAGESVLSWLRQGISASGLGFNINSAALQITGFNQSIVRVGAKYIGQGITQFATSPFDSAKMVADKSQFMAERGRTQFREINEIKNRVRGQTEISRRVFAGTYFLMMNMQRSVDIPTWLGAYQKALDAGKNDATAVALADQAVRDSQGSGLVSDLAAVERGGPAMKLFTVFYSYMNTVYNMAAVQTMTARGRGKLAADYAMLFVVPVVLGYAIKSLLQPNTDDEEFDPEALARKLAAEELSYMMGTMIIAREFGGAAQLLTGAEGVRMGYGGPAGLRAIGEVYGLATQAGQLEFDRAFRRSAVNTLGAFTGLPAAQINRTIDGIEAVVEGEVEGVGAVVAPLTGVQR
jgi:hypothetical protein